MPFSELHCPRSTKRGLSSPEAAPHSPPSPALAKKVVRDFEEFVRDPLFPCLAGKGVVQRQNYTLGVYGRLGTSDSAAFLARDLAAFTRQVGGAEELSSCVAVFTEPLDATEEEFERALWQQLQHLHDRDDPAARWDPRVSSNPEDPRFSFSFAGHAYFVIGLHPGSSRMARRLRWPALVFNLHEQFERLRDRGQFEPLKEAIRARDAALQGTINPNLTDFGERSEANQYSGRRTESHWRCPFNPKKGR